MKKTMSRVIGAAPVAALIVAVAACGNPQSNQSGTSVIPTITSAVSADPHNQADVMFARHMIAHHQQAIEMSEMVLAKHGMDPRVVDLANRIKSAQGPEIEQMQSWLSQWEQLTMPMMPDMPGHAGPTAMPSPRQGHDAHNPGAMPGMNGMPGMAGMMSPQDMAALQDAQGDDANKLFLAQMIRHHHGAIALAQREIDTGRFPAATEVAKSIVTTQQHEIDDMQRILASL